MSKVWLCRSLPVPGLQPAASSDDRECQSRKALPGPRHVRLRAQAGLCPPVHAAPLTCRVRVQPPLDGTQGPSGHGRARLVRTAAPCLGGRAAGRCGRAALRALGHLRDAAVSVQRQQPAARLALCAHTRPLEHIDGKLARVAGLAIGAVQNLKLTYRQHQLPCKRACQTSLFSRGVHRDSITR